MRHNHRHPYGVVRRELLQVGFSGFLGMSLPGLLARRATAADGATRATAPTAAPGRKPVRSVVLVFLTGGPSHHDTFDMKPDAPAEIRGEFNPVATSVPGITMCEHLPGLAAQADKLAIVRSFSHHHNNHLNGTHQVLTGHPQPGAFFDKIASRDDYPCYAATLEYTRPRTDGLPSGVMLPTFLMEGPLVWPGQHAGFLGPRFDPWQITDDPNRRDFQVDHAALPEGFSVERLSGRRKLYDEIQTQADGWLEKSESAAFSNQRSLAYTMLLSGNVARAFRLKEEPDQVRDRYGRHTFGQSLLLARRLVEVGVPIVQVNMGRVQTWDSHGDIFRRLRDDLLPPTDRGVSALLEDLSARGLLDETLVVVCGEFGRTPKLGLSGGGTVPGRDHWPQCFSAVFAGGGVRGGQVIGSSDRVGAYPATKPFTPADLGATIYGALGLDPETELRDRLNRPIRVVAGRPIDELYA